METFGVASIHDFLSGILTVHQDVNALVIVCREGFDHFNGQVILALEGDPLGFAIFTLVVWAEIKGVRLAVADDMRRNEIVTPDGLAFFMRILKAKCLHFLGRSVFLAAGVIYDQEYDSSGIAALELCFPNAVHDRLYPSALHAIHTPWRMIQEIGDTAQMTVIFGSVLDLRDIFTPGTKNDAMDESKQMSELLENSNFSAKMNLTIGM
jgi:hypothetical protein